LSEALERIAELEQTSALRMLLFLNKVGKAGRFDLILGVKASQTAIYNALRNLLKVGLIRQIKPVGYPYRKDVELTERGRKVVEYLIEIEKLLLEQH
jgi:DNA-binding HxlR family transcriptional regulator